MQSEESLQLYQKRLARAETQIGELVKAVYADTPR